MKIIDFKNGINKDDLNIIANVIKNGGLDTVGIRIPNNKIVHEIIKAIRYFFSVDSF